MDDNVIYINYPETRKFLVLLRRESKEKRRDSVHVCNSVGDDVFYAEEILDLLADLRENNHEEFLRLDEAMFQVYNKETVKLQYGKLVSLNTYRETRKFIRWFNEQQEKSVHTFAVRLTLPWSYFDRSLIEGKKGVQELLDKVNANSDPAYLKEVEQSVFNFLIIEKRKAEKERMKPSYEY